VAECLAPKQQRQQLLLLLLLLLQQKAGEVHSETAVGPTGLS
jgi:hypothetical protein